MAASGLPRIQTLDARVRASELFPRIRDAENEMKRNEDAFLAHMKLRDSRRRTKELEKGKKRIEIVVNATPKAKREIIQKQYFTSYVLNKDPNCSKYMPFDEVYFPKLFNADVAQVGPSSIDTLWLLGFQDLATRKAAPPEKKAKKEVVI